MLVNYSYLQALTGGKPEPIVPTTLPADGDYLGPRDVEAPNPLIPETALSTSHHGSNSPVINPGVIISDSEDGWITVSKKSKKKTSISIETLETLEPQSIESSIPIESKTSVFKVLKIILNDQEWPKITLIDVKDAYEEAQVDPEVIEGIGNEPIILVPNEDNHSEFDQTESTAVLTSAKVADSDVSLSTKSDNLTNSDDLSLMSIDTVEETCEETVKEEVPERIHCMTISEYTNGFFNDFDTLHITPNQQVLPEREVVQSTEIPKFIQHHALVVTRSRNNDQTNEITPMVAVTGGNNNQVDNPIEPNETGNDESVGNNGDDVEDDIPTPIQPRELLVTPTNPSDANENNSNDGSIGTNEVDTMPRDLTNWERLQKYVAMEYMAETLELPLADDLPIRRYINVYNNMPAHEIHLFTYEFHHGKGTATHLQITNNNNIATGGPTIQVGTIPQQQLPPPPPLVPPPPPIIMEPPTPNIGTTLPTPNVRYSQIPNQFNITQTPITNNGGLQNLMDTNANQIQQDDDGNNETKSRRKLLMKLTANLYSFEQYFAEHSRPGVTLDFKGITWHRLRANYVESLKPTDPILIQESDTLYSEIFHKINKSSLSTKMENMMHFVSQKKRAENYRRWTSDLYFVLQQDTWTSKILDERGKVLPNQLIPWFALKAASLVIQQKVDINMRHHFQNIDKNDPVSILIKFETLCGGINETTVLDTRLEFEGLLIGENESATNFIVRAVKVFDTCHIFGIQLSEEDRVDKLIHALRGNNTYKQERGELLERRRNDKRYPDRPYCEQLTVQEITNIMNDRDGEIYEGSHKKQAKKQKFNNFQSNSRHRADQAEVTETASPAVVATSRNNQFQRFPCFHCNSMKHKINDCPTASEEQKAKAWLKFKEAQAIKQAGTSNKSESDKTFVSNKYQSSSPSSNSTPQKKNGKQVRFTKTKKQNEANVVSTHVNISASIDESNHTINHRTVLKGIPPVHQSQLGKDPMNYWLVDSGASAHMTPYVSDLDTNSFQPGNGFVRVANNEHENIIGTGNVTILIKCYETGENITWTLYDVLVVPELARRLISTDELTESKHSVNFEPSGMVIILREHQNANIRRKTTVIKMATEWEFDAERKQYHWPSHDYQAATRDPRPAILVSPVFLNTEEEAVSVEINEDNNALAVQHNDENEFEISETQAGKRAVHLQLIHNRFGHRSIESLLLGNRDSIWNDIKVQRDPETICQTCQITLSRKTARNRRTTADQPTEPGRMIMTDIIANPFNVGLNKRSHTDYYILIVDVYSTLPALLGLKSLTAANVIRTLKMYLATIKPKINEPRPASEINLHPLQHIRADAGSQFTSAEFLQSCHDDGINVSLAAPKHQEMNGICERTWQSIRNLAFSFMNFARVGEEFGGMALEHAWKVFAILPIKGLRKHSSVTTPYELFYGIKPSVRKFRILFCPCVYKIYVRSKTVSSKRVQHFDSKTHPQRGVIGIFCGFPRSQAGYLIWEPRSKKLLVSADVQFDEKFHSMGPRKHFAFRDALPVLDKTTQPHIDNFIRTDNDDDHDGTPRNNYTEENKSNGFINMMTGATRFELFDEPSSGTSQQNQCQSDTQSDNESSMEERSMEEQILEEQSDDGQSSLEENGLPPSRSQSKVAMKRHSTKNDRANAEDEDDDGYYKDPVLLIQQPVRRSKRQHKRRRIFDPSNNSTVVSSFHWTNMVTKAFDQNIPSSELFHYLQTVDISNNTDISGSDPASFLPEPKSLKKVASLEPSVKNAWLKAFRSELMNLINKDTFEQTTEYKGEHCLPVCAIFKTKIKADGSVDKLKVRIAIRGDLDRQASDEDNSAPLATFRLLKVFLAEAARMKRRVYQADFIGAYLQAKMDRLVYVILPKEYAEYFPDLAQWFGTPLVLRKSAYGINSAGRLWAEELFGWYTEFGFMQSTVEPSLFKYNKNNEWIILLSYCDDTAYFASSDTIRKEFESTMCRRFDCKLLGQLHWFLQARVTQDQAYNITIDQSRYATSMSKRFLPNEEVLNPSEEDKLRYLAPLPNGIIFTIKDRSKDVKAVKVLQQEFQLNYPAVIGSLLWVMNTYPRLQFAIRKLAKFMNLPGRVHFKALRHLLHHVRCHHLCGIRFYANVHDAPISKLLFEQGINPMDSPFFAFADSSWQDCPDTSRSTGGYHIIFQGGIVESATTFPTPVAKSSAEAEYNNASIASAAVNAMAMLVQDIRFGEPDKPLRIPLLLDNKACISMGESFKDSKRTRHILRGYHHVRWMIQDGRVVLVWIPSDVQLADPATKSLLGTAKTLVLFRETFEVLVLL